MSQFNPSELKTFRILEGTGIKKWFFRTLAEEADLTVGQLKRALKVLPDWILLSILTDGKFWVKDVGTLRLGLRNKKLRVRLIHSPRNKKYMDELDRSGVIEYGILKLPRKKK